MLCLPVYSMSQKRGFSDFGSTSSLLIPAMSNIEDVEQTNQVLEETTTQFQETTLSGRDLVDSPEDGDEDDEDMM